MELKMSKDIVIRELIYWFKFKHSNINWLANYKHSKWSMCL